jgi:hypothetical protein
MDDKPLIRHMPGVTNEIYEAPHSGYLMSRLKLEKGTKFKFSNIKY